MLKIVTLICILAGLLTAVLLESWLKSHTDRNEITAGTYSEVRSRFAEFWSIQYIPLLIMLALVGAALFIFVGRINAAVYLGGAALCFVSLFLGSVTAVSGSIATLSSALKGDMRGSLKAAYRSGSVMGLAVTSAALAGLGVLFFFLDTDQLLSLVGSFALGATVVALCLGVSGTAFSGAYSLTVREDDFTDYTGMFIGSAADYTETYILSACAAALLAGIGAATSGVTSTFTAASAARYPLLVYAAGIVASVIGILAYRGRIVKNPASYLTVGNIIAAVLIIAVSVYFSNEVLQSYMYSFCIAAGVIASVVSGEIAKAYSAYGPIFMKHLPDTKKAGTGPVMIYSLSIGMISVIIPAVITSAALIVGYKFANYYGIALAAAGANSMAAVNSAVRGFSVNTASASEIAAVKDPDAGSPAPSDVLLTASASTDCVGKTYSSVAVYVTLIAMFTALSVSVDNPSVLLLSTPVFAGITIGAVSVFVCAGLLIRAVRLTGYVLRNRDADYPEKRIGALRGVALLYFVALIIPFAAGAAGGVQSLIAFTFSSAVTGMCLIFAFNNSGRFFDRVAAETLGIVIKLMAAVALVFAPAFMNFAGLL